MKKIIVKFLVCVFILDFYGMSYADNQGITLDQAIAIALQNNPGLKAVNAQVEEAFFGYKSAASLPPLTLSGNYNGGSNPNATTNGTAQDVYFVLSQSFGPIGSIGLAGKAAYQGYLATASGYSESVITLIQNVKDAFYALLAAQEQLRVANENQDLAAELYKIAGEKFKAGAVPELDFLNAKIQEAAAEQGVLQALGALKQAQAAFNALLAFPQAGVTQVSGNFDLSPVVSNADALVQLAESGRPALKQAQQILEQAKTEMSFSKSQRNPNPSLFFDQDVSITSFYTAGISLQFPLFDWGQIRNQVKVQEETVIEKQHDLEQTLLTVDSAVKSAHAAYEAAFNNASTYKEKVLDPSERLMEMTQFGYQHGGLPYLEVLTAEQTLRSARTQYVSLLLTGHQAMDALEAAVGKPLEGEK